MPWIRQNSFLRSRDFWIGVAIVLLFVASGLIVAPLVKRGYNRWATSRYTRRAAEFLQSGDYKQARDNAQSAMGINPWNPEAIRIMAKSLEGSSPKEAIQWRKHLERSFPGDPENTLALARDAVKNGNVDGADRSVRILQAADRNSPGYHDVAARIALAKRDVPGATAQWTEALKLDPHEDEYRLNLAALQVKYGTPAASAAALEVLKALSAKPDKRLGSLRAMIDYALKRGDDAQAKELAKTLATDPKATFEDKLLRLGTLRSLNDPDATPLLLELRDASIPNPEELFPLLAWMNQNNLALMVSDWMSSLPENVVSAAPVGVAIAEACARGSEWKKLKQLLERSQWGHIESVRLTFLSRALLRLSENEASDVAWKAALAAAQGNADLLESMAKTSMDWEWKERAEEALWKLSVNPRCPGWAFDALRSWSSQRGDAVQLHRVSTLLARKDPTSVRARNDAVFFGLLIRSRERGLHEKAEEIYREKPESGVAAATFGLSLYERARANEAVALMETLKPGQLRDPEVARYYGLFLVATGQSGKAEEYLALGAGGAVLREEAALLALAKMGSSGESAAHFQKLNAAAVSNGEDFTKLITWMNGHDLAPLVSAWSASVDREFLSKPPVAVVIAEADAKALEWSRLKDATEAVSWGELDYLRSAFQSRALDRLNDSEGAASSWKEALESAKKNADDLDALAKTALGWGWQEQAEAVLWELSSFDNCPRWALDTLWAAASKRRDSAQLYRVGRLLAEMDPKSIVARNNVISLALLTRAGEVSTHELAETLYKEAPADPEVATTYGLSLYLRGRIEDAVAVMRTLTLGQLSQPRPAFYHGVFLTADKQEGEAGPYVEIGMKRAQLPEEKELFAMAKLGPSAESAGHVRQLNEAAVSSPENLARLIRHLIGNDSAPLVSGWSVSLARELASKPPVSVAVAEAHTAAMEWTRLKETADLASWGRLDYLRAAFLSRALGSLNDAEAAGIAWKAALEAAQKDPASLEILARTVLGWGWEQKAEGVLWRLAGDPFCPRWALESLWKISLKRRTATQLSEISRLMPGADPKRERSRNDALVLALLTHCNDGPVRQFAEALYKEAPANGAVASVHAISLWQQDRRDAAMAIVGPFKAEGLREFRSAFYYGVFLTVTGEAERADEYLDIAARGRLLREEEASIALAKIGASAEDTACLRQLNEAASSKPEELSRLVTDLTGRDRAPLVSAWSVVLAAEQAFKLPARIAIAEAHERAAAWSRLKEAAESGVWGRLEYRRNAFLSRALEQTNDIKGAALAWKAAMEAAQKSPDAMETLAKAALRWGWQDRAEEVLWKISGHDRCPGWALEALRDASFKRGGASQIYEVSKLLAKASPKNPSARNDVNFFGLLSHRVEAGLHESAEAIYKENPANGDFVTTYALSLHERSRVKEALASMETLKAEQLREPKIARYYGIFLSTAGQPDKAREYLKIGANGPLLREEIAMLALAKLGQPAESTGALRQLNAAAASKPEELAGLVTQLSGKGLAPLVSAWSIGLPPGLVSRPPVCIVIADAHAKASEWARLKEATEGGSWEQLDYLRRAFLSRTLSSLGDADGAADAWRAALSAAEKNPELLETLAKTALEWGWPEKAEQVLWQLASREGCPQSAIELLSDFARKRRTAGQQAQAGGTQPPDGLKMERTRNNALVLALLTRGNDEAIRKLAEAHHGEAQGNAAAAAIHALSMTLQGRGDAALTMMGAFKPEELREPRAALYHGIFLSMARQADQAKEYLEIAASASLSPEDKSLLLRVKAMAPPPQRPATPGSTTLVLPPGPEPAIR